MKKIYLILLGTVLLFSSCQKSISDFDPSSTTGTGTTPAPTGSGSFEATVNGQKLTFTITAATLVRSALYNEKRVDVTGTSSDGTKRITVTLGEETALGNAVTVKKYVLNPFPDDDPATPAVDESLTTQGFTTYSTKSGASWVTSVYDENGSFTVSSCDAAATLISGTFDTALTDLFDNSVVKITAGKLTNIKYTVLN